jgi:hypothetical protein
MRGGDESRRESRTAGSRLRRQDRYIPALYAAGSDPGIGENCLFLASSRADSGWRGWDVLLDLQRPQVTRRGAAATAEWLRRHPPETPSPGRRNGVSVFRPMCPQSIRGRARVADSLTPQTRSIACEALSRVSRIEIRGDPSGLCAGLETVGERRDVTAAEHELAKDRTTATGRDRTRAGADGGIDQVGCHETTGPTASQDG